MICTTLKAIKKHHPCTTGWVKLLEYLDKTEADDEPLPFYVILKSNGLDDALWACRAAPEHNHVWRLFGVWCARQVQNHMIDQRSLNALDVAERHANGTASDEELSVALGAAYAAWDEAWDAARDAAYAAWGAAYAAWDEAWDEAWDAAYAARDAARDAAQDAQAKHFISIVGKE